MPRPVRICECGDHAWVILTQGMVSLIDPEFAPACALWNWFAKNYDGRFYAVRTHHETPRSARKSYTLRLHNMVLSSSGGFVIDHRNGDTLDNRRGNLRFATPSQNRVNSRKLSGCSSQYRGVTKVRDKWQAVITVAGQQTHLGLHRREEDAARAYDAAALTLHGEFAKPNFSAVETA